jgi:hypothetical protein
MEKTPEIELDIAKAMSLLEAKANQYTPEEYAHYVVIGEDEREDDSCETFCEKCIDKAVAKSNLRYRKERAKLQLLVKDLEKNGYAIRKRYNSDFEEMGLTILFGGEKEIGYFKNKIEKEFPEEEFSYRYYQLDSTTSHKNCDLCGVIIHSYVTADDQEMEHWEDNFEDKDFVIEDIDEYTAYQLYSILEFIHQAKPDIYKRGHNLAKRIIKVNTPNNETAAN